MRSIGSVRLPLRFRGSTRAERRIARTRVLALSVTGRTVPGLGRRVTDGNTVARVDPRRSHPVMVPPRGVPYHRNHRFPQPPTACVHRNAPMSPSRTQVWYGEKYIQTQTVASNVTHMISATFTLSLICASAKMHYVVSSVGIPCRDYVAHDRAATFSRTR